MRKKTFICLLSISSLIGLLYVFTLFMPYFIDVDKVTGAVHHVVYGFRIGLGKSGLSDVRIIGSYPILLCQILGFAGAIMNIVFSIWYLKRKKDSSFIYFLFGLTIPFFAFAIAGVTLSWSIYQGLNTTGSSNVIYTGFYFASLFSAIIIFLINSFLLSFFAINRKKEEKFVTN